MFQLPIVPSKECGTRNFVPKYPLRNVGRIKRSSKRDVPDSTSFWNSNVAILTSRAYTAPLTPPIPVNGSGLLKNGYVFVAAAAHRSTISRRVAPAAAVNPIGTLLRPRRVGSRG